MYQLYWTQTAATQAGFKIRVKQGWKYTQTQKRLVFLNKYCYSEQLFILVCLCVYPWKLSETLLQAAVKSWAGKGNLIFCLFKRSEIHTTMDKLIQNVLLMQVCLSALLIDARMILTHWRVGGTLWISFMTVHKVKWLGPNTSKSTNDPSVLWFVCFGDPSYHP